MKNLTHLLAISAVCFSMNVFAADEVQTQQCPEGEEFVPPIGKCAKVIRPTEEEMKKIKAEIEKMKAAEKHEALPAAAEAASEAGK